MNVFPETQAPQPSPRVLWNVDPIHSTVGFSVRHLMIANVHGVFERVAGSVTCDPTRPETAQVDVTVTAASVHTREPQRDAHLRSADFFDVERFPLIGFRSTQARRSPSGRIELVGELTLRGITRSLTLEVTEVTGEQRDFQGARRFGASARAKLSRAEFGMTFNKLLEAGNVGIGDEVSLSIDVSLVEVGSSGG